MIQGVAAEVETRKIAYLLKRKARRAITRTAGFDGGPVFDQLGDAFFSDLDSDLLVCRKTGQGTRPDCHCRPLRRPAQN